MSLLLWIAYVKFRLLTSPSFAKIHISSILILATRPDPRKFPASTAVARFHCAARRMPEISTISFKVLRISLLLWIAYVKFRLLTSPFFAKIHILSILILATRRDPLKFPVSSAVAVLAFPSSYLKVPIFPNWPATACKTKIWLRTWYKSTRRCQGIS